MVRMIMEMVGNRSFTFTTGNNKRSRLRRLKDFSALQNRVGSLPSQQKGSKGELKFNYNN